MSLLHSGYGNWTAGLECLLMVCSLSLKRWRDENRWEELEEDRCLAQPFTVERGETAEIVGEAVRSLPPLQRFEIEESSGPVLVAMFGNTILKGPISEEEAIDLANSVERSDPIGK